MERQTELPLQIDPPGDAGASLGLVIGKKGDEGLSKAQRSFNRLIRRIEALREAIARSTAEWEANLAFCTRELVPLEADAVRLQKELVPLLVPFLSRRDLGGKRSRRLLRDVIGQLLEDILGAGAQLDSPELKAAFKAVEGRSFEDAFRDDMSLARAEMEDFCEFHGINVDFSDLGPEATEEAMARKIAEISARLKETPPPKEAGTRRGRPRTPRALDREARERAAEELRARDLGRFYKQLAKLLHPDLEQDPAVRREKEAAMKVLTTAYRAGDLHTMLRLELEWIVREQADVARLSDEKLAVYNAVLKEQVTQMEGDLREVGGHPRFEVVRRHRMSGELGFLGVPTRFDGPAIRERLRQMCDSFAQSIQALRTDGALAEVKLILAVRAETERG